MGIRSVLAKPFASYIASQSKKWSTAPAVYQMKILHYLVEQGKKTQFGKDHNFSAIKTYEDFKRNVPIRDYEGLKSYVEKVVHGEGDILWKGKPEYFAKTSGTTSGTKYIPI